MRISLKYAVLSVALLPFFFMVYQWGKCDLNHVDTLSRDGEAGLEHALKDPHGAGYESFHPRAAQSYNHVKEMEMPPLKYREIECVINGDYSVKGRREGKEIYLPFSFIQKYFEVYGSVEQYDGYDRFEFQHSYSQVFPPGDKYTPSGVFMSFEYYNVEDRNRVKCISGVEGVPVSTQWDNSGHFYPIQIAQYGLSHYSKYLGPNKRRIKVLENGNDMNSLGNWMLTERRSQLAFQMDNTNMENTVVEFATQEQIKNPGISLSVDEGKLFTLSMDIKFMNKGSITVLLRTGEGNIFRIHYIQSNEMMRLEGRDLYYGIGKDIQGKWIHFSRMILIDFQKGLTLKHSKSKSRKIQKTTKIAAICLRGRGLLDNMTLSNNAHLDFFFDAANYLVRNQDYRGGWPIMVKRSLIPDVMELDPGWYSAMGQGQAISLLVRAYLVSKDKKYLDAAGKALEIFELPSDKGGVVSKYAFTYDWFEEYPTKPSSFVLNGFIYSLIGLYDLKEVASGPTRELAEKLYNSGSRTLKAMLLMFDNGSGTFYDLRHITAGLPPNRARWDYHTVHINQLLLLSQIDSDPLFSTTAQRWQEYMKGHRSPHN
ncbi:hypothetical protein FSP39_021688 [Pinctada imbricata]|uniref:heparosan-N-sulfate-glucuronate 5-epimerase n=1 Tax=Pinctada imbricata TaxID=66713 RepID=A0AA88YPA2_PINIB|nr:hypothetical protein FSP39_021688 [Pinctada imbricata]